MKNNQMPKIHSEYQGYDKEHRCYWFYNNMYSFNLYLYFGDRKPKLDTSFDCLGKCIIDERNDIIIRIDNKKNYDIIAHECLHAVSYIFRDRGIKYDYNNDEPVAYLLAWFMKCFMTVIK